MILKTHVICLFEESGLSADDWARNGFEVFCYDLAHKEARREGNKHFLPWNAYDHAQNCQIYERHLGRVAIVLAFPPCTDLAVSGSKHFQAKQRANPNYRREAMALVYVARDLSEALQAPYAIENPVSVISSEWRKPDHVFHPWEYGGYLPFNDIHPIYPEYIAPRDAYPKKTCYWTGCGFVMPPKLSVDVAPGYSTQFKKLGGKSEKTKRIRSASPRGIARAIYFQNNS